MHNAIAGYFKEVLYNLEEARIQWQSKLDTQTNMRATAHLNAQRRGATPAETGAILAGYESRIRDCRVRLEIIADRAERVSQYRADLLALAPVISTEDEEG